MVRTSATLLLLSFVCRPGFAEPVELGRVGVATVSYAAEQGLSGLHVTIGDVQFEPLAGAAALGTDGKADPAIPLQIEPTISDGVLRVSIRTSHASARGVEPGRVQGLGEWRRVDLSRYCEPYGQAWWPKTNYSVTGDFWFTAHWVLEESQGTQWHAVDEGNRGTGPFPAALQVIYEPDTKDDYLPIHEVLELRFSKSLWDVVPPLRQKASEYRDVLTKSVFVDFWDGSPVAKLRHILQILKAVGREQVPYYTILQTWEAGGWDALLPDSMWLPDYPPDPKIGTLQELRDLCEQGRSLGRFGFRTNYRVLRERSPSFQRGCAHYAVDSQGKQLEYLRCADWLPVARRADQEIFEQFAPNAAFTDQMTSGAAPWSWHDYAAEGGSRSMRQTLEHQRALARSMKETFGGPLSSESLSDQHLVGEFVDAGDYGIMNGHARLVSPEFKLRRLHALSGFHGMGLMYRFYEMPPFDRFHTSTMTFQSDMAQLDDYRACEILFGNGGYVCFDFANWQYYLTEILLVGHLQQYYSGCPVRRVLYWHAGQWTSLEEFVRQGNAPNVVPWNPQTEAFGRIRVEYENGLNIVVNRLAEPFTLDDQAAGRPVLPPQSGWVAWMNDQSLFACSAYWPGTQHRMDFMRDHRAGVVYIDPRGQRALDVTQITLWEAGNIVLTADLDRKAVTVDGTMFPFDSSTSPEF
ncbi:MAG: hypothetical protein ACYC3X_26670 [Pirellulaceae bacterium]